MFQIRTEQDLAFFRAARTPFHQRILVFLRETIPQKIAGMADDELLKRIDAFDQDAVAYGLTTERGITQFVWMAFALGPDFVTRPEFSAYWNLPHPGPDAKMDLFVNTLADYKAHEQKRTTIDKVKTAGTRVLGLLIAIILSPVLQCMSSLSIVAGAGAGFGAAGAEGGAATGLAALGPVGWAVLIGVVVVAAGIILYNEAQKAKEKSKEVPKTKAPTGKQACSEKEQEKIDEILKDATPGKDSKSKQYSKPGGFDQANEDFDNLVGNNAVKDRGGGLRTAELPSGTKVNVRPFSSGNTPTLEIQPPQGQTIKIRYP